MTLKIVEWPDKRLTKISSEVEEVNDETRLFLDKMLETMYNSNGIGLAAVQVGRMERMIVIDINFESPRYKKNEDIESAEDFPLFLINPKIIDKNKTLSSYNEGCLSFPGQYSKVSRPKKVTIEYLDYHGKFQSFTAEGLLATCIQHEIDHINGIVFIDHISKLKRGIIENKINKKHKLQ